MRVWLTVAVVGVIVGAGGREAAAQADEGWWNWATPLVASESSGRVAIPRTTESPSGEAQTRTRVPPPPSDTRDEPAQAPQRRPPDQTTQSGSGDGRVAQPAPAPAGRGRGAQAPQAGRGQGPGRGNAGVPAFCRTGAGHPVFGWQWCVDRGFGSYQPQWQRERWTDVISGWPRQQREGRVDSRRLETVLGDVVFGRLRAQAGQVGAGAPLEGRWVRPQPGVLVLQVRAGDFPIAEFSDTSGDGRADVVLVNRVSR